MLNYVDLLNLNMVKCVKWSWKIPKYLINEHICSEGFVESYEWLEIWYTFCGCRFHEGPVIISKISLKCFILLQNISEIFIVKPQTVLTYWTLFCRPKHESFSHSYCPTVKCTTVPREQSSTWDVMCLYSCQQQDSTGHTVKDKAKNKTAILTFRS